MKLGKAKLDLEFLKNCKNRLVIPKFLRFKVANRRLRNSSAYRQCQNKLLQDEIAAKHARIRILSSQGTVAYSNLAALVSSVDLIHLKSVSDHENTKRLNQNQKIQDRKLFRLCAETKSDNSIDPNTVVFNFSQQLITDQEKEILSKGLNFSIPPNKLDYFAFLAPFETLHKKLIKEDLFEKSGYFPASVNAKLKDIAYSGYRSYSRPDFLFSKEDIKLLQNLKNDNKIVIVKPDKGNGIVILDRNDYNKKMNDILQDNTKFQRLNDDPVKLTLQRENQLKKLLATLKKSESITPETYDKLYPTGSRIGILYGLPKIHKCSTSTYSFMYQ